jgi:hypothetical protein
VTGSGVVPFPLLAGAWGSATAELGSVLVTTAIGV